MDMNTILIYFAIKYMGDWDKIYKALEKKEKIALKEITELEEKIKNENWNVLTILDAEYPQKMKEAYKPPFVIWYAGMRELLSAELICLTGNQTNESIKKWIIDFTPEVEKNNNIITTDFKGVDEEIKRYSKKGRVFVLAGGLDRASKTEFFHDTDLIISEYPYNAAPMKENFRNRNRIIAALAESVVLFSSQKNGGINNLVNNFLNLGKEVYCFPGDGSAEDGNSELIKQGANLITSINDVKNNN